MRAGKVLPLTESSEDKEYQKGSVKKSAAVQKEGEGNGADGTYTSSRASHRVK